MSVFDDAFDPTDQLVKTRGLGVDTWHPEKHRDRSDPFDYSKGVPVAVTETGDIVTVPLTGTTRLGLFGPSGSGKTVLAKRLLSVAVEKKGCKAVHVSDVKNDFRTVNKYGGVQQSLIDSMPGLLDEEHPSESRCVLAVPNFLVPMYESRPNYATVFSMRLSDMSKEDFKWFIGYFDWRSTSKQETLDSILGEVSWSRASVATLVDKAHEHGKDTLVRALETFQNKRLVSNRTNHGIRDIVGKLSDVDVVSLGLRYYDRFLRGDRRVFQFPPARFLEQVTDEAKNGDLKADTVVAFADEFHKLAPAGDESKMKEVWQNNLDLDARQASMPMILSTQRPSQVPNADNDDDLDFISPIDHAFIMSGTTSLADDDFKPLLKSLGVYRGGGGKQLQRWRRKINRLEQHQGIYVSAADHSGPGDCPVIESLTPLWHHAG